jgi:RsmE family RNA methyltransferase
MNLIIIQKEELDADSRVVLTNGRARHIRKVLKAEPGKGLKIGLLNGALGNGTVEAVDKDSVVMKCAFEPEPPPTPAIDLLLAMPRPKVMKRLWAQLAALGVGHIVLVNADKLEKYYFDSHVLEPEFYNALLIEGLQQARCTHLPEVLVRQRFKPFVEDELDSLFPRNLRLLADPNGRKKPADFFQGLEKPARVLLAVGPEGGWTPYELEKLQSHGFELVGMGARILRTDTACVGLLSVLAEYLRM